MKTGAGFIMYLIASTFLVSCKNNKLESEVPETPTHTNELIHETSPYLLQHAHNPVEWKPWGEEAFREAREKNKLVLVSIGYSSCHWCHVMEHESFEDTSVARLMNAHFVCIKVDREERPDVDQVYMSAVQIMTGHGGWPLNCFTLPDGRPVYGGTYFRKEQWIDILGKLKDMYAEHPDQVTAYADKLTAGIRSNETIIRQETFDDFDETILTEMIEKWQMRFDDVRGGNNQAPKFPLPNNYQFLLRYAHLYGNKPVLDHVNLTLTEMARGGIYDQIGGGFARYSVDERWKVPHFEKMLYDNAQLMSLYSEAFQVTGNTLYKEIVYQTYDFIIREMTSEEGVFYSALDADSEGVEGRYYVWEKDEMYRVLGDDAELAIDYYNVDGKGKWEEGSILLRSESDEIFAEKYSISVRALKERVKTINKKLLKEREKRVRPGLDDKSLTSWNALMVSGLLSAYNAFGDERFKNTALTNLDFLLSKQMGSDGSLKHSYKNGTAKIAGYLEDYCFMTEALLEAYQTDFNEEWLGKARILAEYAITHFYDDTCGMFQFTDNNAPQLIARTTEYRDNVIPASNSSMAKVLYLLGTIDYNKRYLDMSNQMLANVQNGMPAYGSGFSNWGQLALWHTRPFYEIAITGPDCEVIRKEFGTKYIPNRIFTGAKTKSDIPLLKGKFTGESTIYVCVERNCKKPVYKTEEALKLIE